MASIIGHAFAGIITKEIIQTKLPSKKENLLLCLSIFFALLPDFDIIFYLAFKPSNMIPHRGFSHGLLFSLITALVFTLLTVRYLKISKLRIFSIYYLALFSHLLLDYLMGAGPPVAFFRPFFERGFLSPIKLIPTAFYSTTTSGLLEILYYPPAILGYCLELLIFLPIVLFFKKTKKQFKLLFISLFAIICTSLIYN
jgi:inner membrane protein